MNMSNRWPRYAIDVRTASSSAGVHATSRRIALAGSLVLVLAWSAFVVAQTEANAALTEERAILLALERPVIRDLVQGGVGVAEGNLIEAQTLPNPHFELEREQVTGAPAGVIERTARFAQRFDFSGRRGLRIEAARTRVEVARADGEARRKELIYDVRRRFHETLALQATHDALTRWSHRLAEAEQRSATLQKGGEVAGYDRRRIARERLTAEARLQALQADRARAGESLATLMGNTLGPAIALEGMLLPDDPRPLADLLAMLSDRPELRSVALRAESFRREEQAAQRAWIPDVTLGAGIRHIDAGVRTDSGFLLSVSVPLPLFDRGEGPRRRAAAQVELTVAQLALARERAEGDVRGLWMQSRQLNEAARRFGTEALDASRRLVQIAEAAYRGGETTILDLLDTYRGMAEGATRAIELALAARLARLELDFLSGEPTR